MGILIYFLFPFLLLAAAGGLGGATALYFSNGSTQPHNDKQRMALFLAIAIPVVGAAAVLISRSTEFTQLYGPFLEYLWVWCLCAFGIGAILGCAVYRQPRITLRFVGGLAVGGAVGASLAFVAASLLLMPPADMLRWVQHRDSVQARLARVFSPERELADLRSASMECREALEKQTKRGNDLEFRAAVIEKGKTGNVKTPTNSCVQEIDTLPAIRVAVGESSRQLGGRVYIGVTDTNFVGHWCDVSVTTDKKEALARKYMKVSDAMKVETTMGPFKVVLTKAPTAHQGHCEFDLVRE